jgi:dCMP deaminase
MSDEDWFNEAARIAQNALCARAHCGAVIVVDNKIVGQGYNAPPCDDMTNAMCTIDDYDRSKKPKYDLTCCVHAEWRAIMDALSHHPSLIKGSTLYYVRLATDGSIRSSSEPFCTVCSRLALDVGITQFGLFHKDGLRIYDTKVYNEQSYAYHKK